VSFLPFIRIVGRTAIFLFAFVVLILLLALLVFRFQPNLVVLASNEFTEIEVTAKDIETQLWPLSLSFAEFELRNQGAKDALLFQAEQLRTDLDIDSWMSDEQGFGYVEVLNAQINLPELNAAFQTNSGEQSDQDPSAELFDIHDVLGLVNIKLVNTRLLIDEHRYLDFQALNAGADNDSAPSEQSESHILNVELEYSNQQKTLSLHADTVSSNVNGIPNLEIKIENLDLTSLLEQEQISNEQQTSSVSVQNNSDDVDLSWLDGIKSTHIRLHVDNLVYQENRVRDLELKAQIEKGVEIELLQGNVNWELQDDLWLQEKISMAGRLEQGPDKQLDAQLNIMLDKNTVSVEGQFNLASPEESTFDLDFATNNLPLVDNNGEASQILVDMAQWLPVSAQIGYNLGKLGKSEKPIEQITGETEVNLQIKAGASDITGQLVLTNLGKAIQLGKIPSMKARMNSDSLVYNSLNSESEAEEAIDKSDKLFSTDPIDWQWTEGINLDLVFDVAALKLDDFELSDLHLPIQLNEGVLLVEELRTNLGSGVVDGSLEVVGSHSSGLTADLEMQANGFALQELELLDPKQLNGGTSNLEMAFSSSGLSAHDLAKNLNGRSLIHVKDAKIGNDTFELIGSDLISELLVKLNPFVRSDPTTELKCAVVNLSVENGIVDIDKSVVVETSKMLIVADGKIDLDSEKIDIEISPQATSGVGIDLSSLVKFMEVGGTLSKPAPKVGADGLLKTGVAVGAAVSTGGLSLLADGLMSKITAGGACKTALAKGSDESEGRDG